MFLYSFNNFKHFYVKLHSFGHLNRVLQAVNLAYLNWKPLYIFRFLRCFLLLSLKFSTRSPANSCAQNFKFEQGKLDWRDWNIVIKNTNNNNVKNCENDKNKKKI